MPYNALLTQTATLHLRTPGTEDEHGNSAMVESNLEVPGFASRQVATEPAPGQGAVVGETMRLFLRSGVPLTGWDAVTIGGERFEVIGAPWEVFDPRRANVHHVEADIRRASTSG